MDDFTSYTLRLPTPMYLELQRVAKEDDRSMNMEIIRVVRAWLEERASGH